MAPCLGSSGLATVSSTAMQGWLPWGRDDTLLTVAALLAESELENNDPWSVFDIDRPSRASDNAIDAESYRLPSDSDKKRNRSAIGSVETTLIETEYYSLGDEATVSTEHRNTGTALAAVSNDETTAIHDRLLHPTDDTEPSEVYHTIEDFVDHRIDPSDSTKVQIRVRWAGHEEQTWEDEWRLQEDAARTLYSYWRSEGGRSCALNLGSDAVYHIFRVLASRGEGGKRQFKCQWVGYPATEQQCSWESEHVVKEIAEGALAAFFDKVYQFC
ncbi:hypothetical protein ACHAPT_010949 [Fusarium lateritium]